MARTRQERMQKGIIEILLRYSPKFISAVVIVDELSQRYKNSLVTPHVVSQYMTRLPVPCKYKFETERDEVSLRNKYRFVQVEAKSKPGLETLLKQP